MELHLTKKDFKLDWFSGTGKGGQNRNKHQNCVRISWTAPDGTVIRAQSQVHRDRPANQSAAFKLLVSRILRHLATVSQGAKSPSDEVTQSTERVRTYHAERNVVIDHASGLERSYKEVVTGGDMSEMIVARRNHQLQKE